MSNVQEKKNLLLLFDRPQEPIFMPKGDQKAQFEVPQSYLNDRYKPISVQLFNRFGDEADQKIPVQEISLPKLGEIETALDKQENFSLFLPKHQRLAGKLLNIFMGMRNIPELQSMAIYCRDRINPYLFNYAYSVALMHRKDTQDLDVPSLLTSFPEKYVDSKVFQRVREEASVVQEGNRVPIEIPLEYTASDLEEEHRVAYFREDIGVNLHHWHWHLVYPFEGPREIVNKNRRGELFFFMHQQLQARYNIERFCNKLNRVERLIDWRKPIKEAYFPKMDSLVASRAYPARTTNMTMSNLNREADQITVDIEDMERYRDRVFNAIHSGFAMDENGGRVQLGEFDGIDILGNMVDSSILSPNRDFYGQLHNLGHTFLSYIHDPDHRHLETFSPIGDSSTAMRDPVFYRWHAYIDDVFQEHKATLPRYTVAQLDYPGVTVQGVDIKTQSGARNRLNTFWQQSDVDLSRGMDFQPRGPVYVRFTHLNHEPFTYNIQVNNAGPARQGTCRIFMAPRNNERGIQMQFREQKIMMIEMDKFTVDLKQGQNTIVRQSKESSLVIPFNRTFRDLDAGRPGGGDTLEAFNYCGCGWPEHMLVPKGTPEGYPMQLFVQISNYADDRIDQDLTGVPISSASFCGIRNKLYPDRRSMGYPFDRMPRQGVDTMQQFLTPNMRLLDVTVNFSSTIRKPGVRT